MKPRCDHILRGSLSGDRSLNRQNEPRGVRSRRTWRSIVSQTPVERLLSAWKGGFAQFHVGGRVSPVLDFPMASGFLNHPIRTRAERPVLRRCPQLVGHGGSEDCLRQPVESTALDRSSPPRCAHCAEKNVMSMGVSSKRRTPFWMVSQRNRVGTIAPKEL